MGVAGTQYTDNMHKLLAYNTAKLSVQQMVRDSLFPLNLSDETDPDSKVHGANMGPIWGRQDPGGPHVGPMNFAIWGIHCCADAIDQFHKPQNPRMHLFHIPQCSIQNRNVHISVLNGALWDMEQVHSGIW